MRTLVIDDDQVFLAVAEDFLRMLGISEIETFTDVASALQAMDESEQEIDLILLDLNIPDLDGISALRSLSESDFRGSVVLVTGERETVLSSVRHIGARLGVNICDAITKPLKPERLNEAIERARSITRPRSQVRDDTQPVSTDKLDPLLYYQVQVDVTQNVIVGAEGLLRSKSPQGVIFGPDTLLQEGISSANRLRLTIDLLSTLCSDLKRLQIAGFQPNLSVNVDASVMEEPSFLSEFVTVVDSFGVNRKQITIELTEHQLPRHPTRLLETLARFGMKGFDTSLDDYGTGGSNFELLQNGAFSEVKIDQSIVKSVSINQASRAFITNVVDLANQLDLRLVAEGIEDESTADFLKQVGISRMQGFLFGKPEPFDQLLARMKRKRDDELSMLYA